VFVGSCNPINTGLLYGFATFFYPIMQNSGINNKKAVTLYSDTQHCRVSLRKGVATYVFDANRDGTFIGPVFELKPVGQ